MYSLFKNRRQRNADIQHRIDHIPGAKIDFEFAERFIQRLTRRHNQRWSAPEMFIFNAVLPHFIA